MTTVPGHNQILQQSGVAQELSHQAHTPKPSPDQAAAIQQAQQVVQNSSIQDTQEGERLKEQKERDRRRRETEKKRAAKRKEDLALDPDATGRLLDTTA